MDPAEPKVSTQAIVLGLGSIFNHSALYQNLGWFKNVARQTITYITLRDIQPEEELTINYGKVWFEDADEPETMNDEDEDPTLVLGRISSTI